MIIAKPKLSEDQFLRKYPRIPFYVRGVSKQGIPVGKHLVLVNGCYIYKFHLKTPIIRSAFYSITSAYAVAKAIDRIYGDYQDILADETWSDNFFHLLRHTVEGGKVFPNFVCKLDNLYPKKVLWDNIVQALI